MSLSACHVYQLSSELLKSPTFLARIWLFDRSSLAIMHKGSRNEIRAIAIRTRHSTESRTVAPSTPNILSSSCRDVPSNLLAAISRRLSWTLGYLLAWESRCNSQQMK